MEQPVSIDDYDIQKSDIRGGDNYLEAPMPLQHLQKKNKSKVILERRQVVERSVSRLGQLVVSITGFFSEISSSIK